MPIASESGKNEQSVIGALEKMDREGYVGVVEMAQHFSQEGTREPSAETWRWMIRGLLNLLGEE